MASKTFVVMYSYVPDVLERRTPHRPDHLQHLAKAKDDGWLLVAGAFANPVSGALFVARAEDPGDILRWVSEDPYVRAGLVLSVEIREWTIAAGSLETA